MGSALLIARFLLASVFFVAGAAKLVDRDGSRRGLLDFGVPALLATPLAILLPLSELAVAVSLIPRATAWWGALGALTLLLLFVAGISANLARGRKPDCRCFGQLHSAPAGWKTLARNGALAAVAGFVVWEGRDGAGASVLDWLGALSTAQLVGLVGGLLVLGLLAGQWWFLVHVLRQNGRLLVRVEALEARFDAGGVATPTENGAAAEPPEGLPVGSLAPTFELAGLYGETLTLDSLRSSGKPVMLLFTDPGCGPCNALLPEIGRWQQEHSGKLNLALISRGTAEENRAKMAEHGLTGVLLQEDWEVSGAYRVDGTPAAVLVQSDGAIGSPVAGGAEAIAILLEHAVGERAELPIVPPTAQGETRGDAQGEPCPNCGKAHAHANGQAAQQAAPAGLKLGEPAPPIRLRDLNNKKVNLAGFRGQKTLVLFWNPGCGFCQQMLPDLKAWEEDPPEGAPTLLVVSAGTKQANKEMGLSSAVVLDRQFAVGQSYWASGTPSAVLVDEEGNVASDLAVGGPAVLSLAGAGQDPTSNGSGGGQGVAAPKIGDPAPALKLPGLGGQAVDLADFRGEDTLVLFWDPGCGFCQQMLPDLKAWESDPPEGAPRLLVVSRGTEENNRAMGLRSTVVLDQDFGAGSAFGARGTPSAVLVDEEGNIASEELAVGAEEVLALAEASQAEV